MRTYTIHPGQRNFRPYELPCPYWKPAGFELQFKFHLGGWCSLADWEFDRDWYDWQKLGGLTRFFSANNRESAMYAFRFGEEEETYEIAAYLNDQSGGWKVSSPMTIRAGVLAQGFCSLEADYARFWARQEDDSYTDVDEVWESKPTSSAVYTDRFGLGGAQTRTRYVYLNYRYGFKRPKLMRRVGTYAGGANNSKGPYGGRAAKTMQIDLSFSTF